MLKIRLARGGAKKKPYYQIVVADSRAPRDGKFIERVGSYNPLLGKDSPDRVKLNVERIQEWMSKGAQPTERVARFLSVADVRPWTHGENPTKGQPGKKAQERAAERTQRETDRAEAEATARAEAAAAPPPAPEPEPETAPEPAEGAGETAEAAADTAAEPTEAASDETPTEGGEAEAETEAQPS